MKLIGLLLLCAAASFADGGGTEPPAPAKQEVIEIPEYGLVIPVETPAEKPPEARCGGKTNVILPNGRKWKGYKACVTITYQ